MNGAALTSKVIDGNFPDYVRVIPKDNTRIVMVDARLFAESATLTSANSAFEIIKVGFEQFVANAAQDYGVLYGVTTAMLAVMTGVFAAVICYRGMPFAEGQARRTWLSQ